jgi:hypothetical protein
MLNLVEHGTYLRLVNVIYSFLRHLIGKRLSSVWLAMQTKLPQDEYGIVKASYIIFLVPHWQRK